MSRVISDYDNLTRAGVGDCLLRRSADRHGLLSKLPQRRHSEGWLIDPNEITICKRPDGSDHVLGTGSSGKVGSTAGRHGARRECRHYSSGSSSASQAMHKTSTHVLCLRHEEMVAPVTDACNTPCWQVYKAMRRSVLPVAVKVVSGAVAKTEEAQLEVDAPP